METHGESPAVSQASVKIREREGDCEKYQSQEKGSRIGQQLGQRERSRLGLCEKPRVEEGTRSLAGGATGKGKKNQFEQGGTRGPRGSQMKCSYQGKKEISGSIIKETSSEWKLARMRRKRQPGKNR